MRIAIYTALFGDYDYWQEPRYTQKGADYFIFTDDKSITVNKYRVMLDRRAMSDVRKARQYKVLLGYEQLKKADYDVIIWHDASITPKADLTGLIDIMHTDIMLMKHPSRDCVYDELMACAEAFPPKDDIRVMRNQVQHYADKYYPENNGMVATGIIIRKPSDDVDNLMLAWWDEIESGSYRDQLSFNYAAWDEKIKFDMINWGHVFTHYFNIKSHKK